MSEYFATVKWCRHGQRFLNGDYSRGHEWHFDHDVVVRASASPHIVRKPFSVEAAVDPEEAFVASVSSCHMLFFLSYAAREQILVEEYIDRATGTMGRNEEGNLALTRIVLRPAVQFASSEIPSLQKLRQLHDESHRSCFIANSVRSEIVIEIDFAGEPIGDALPVDSP